MLIPAGAIPAQHHVIAMHERLERPNGWRTSGRPAGLGLLAWVLAVVVVAIFGLGLHLLYQ